MTFDQAGTRWGVVCQRIRLGGHRAVTTMVVMRAATGEWSDNFSPAQADAISKAFDAAGQFCQSRFGPKHRVF
jgi:hypothetical protein